MGAATTAAPYGFWATNPTKKLAHWVYLLGQPLSRNRVFQNFSGEPPPLKVVRHDLRLPRVLMICTDHKSAWDTLTLLFK